eukprot:Sdes_comp9455_c0_seq1m918
MTDVADILELKRSPSLKAPLGYKSPKIFSSGKEGKSRELYSLSGGRPSAAPSLSCGGYKQIKAQLFNKKAVPWKWTKFLNPSRGDDLGLHHWRKCADASKLYPFHRFNRRVSIPTYSDEEYRKHIYEESQTMWTKADTDRLFGLCREFSLRWVVIFDRWKGPPRTVEELKEHYFDVCMKLLISRSEAGKEPSMENLEAYRYDARHEADRKEQLSKLFMRSRIQAEQEQALCQEYEKLEQREKDREKERILAKKLVSVLEGKFMVLSSYPPPAAAVADSTSVSGGVGGGGGGL